MKTFKLILVTALLLFSTSLMAQGTGKVVGAIYDGETGEELIGANVMLEGTTLGAATDIQGQFYIKGVPAGEYTLIASMIGYEKTRVEEFTVKADEINKIELKLYTEAVEVDEVVVTAKLLENTDASLLKHRQKSVSISDAISSETISRAGGSNAADAMTHVTGASVMDGKYVNVRGLSGRYNNTTLNGSELPNADPDVKSFNLDIFPSSLLDNIVTIKSFTPDMPGNFSGGIVDINTKNYPEEFILKFSSSASFNTITTGADNFLTYQGGEYDWLGFDDGFRSIPGFVSNQWETIPTPSESRRNGELAYKLDNAAKSFNNHMTPEKMTAPLNGSYSLYIADQEELFGSPFGYVVSASYSNKYSFYDDGVFGQYNLPGKTADIEDLNMLKDFNDTKASSEVLWGGLVTMAYKPHPNHDISFNYIRTQSGEKTARTLQGPWTYDLDPRTEGFATQSLLYKERSLSTYQFKGEHFSETLLSSTINWTAAFSHTIQEEPDLRFFSYEYEFDPDTKEILDRRIRPTNYNNPSRYWRNLAEHKNNVNLDISLPFSQWDQLSSKFKFGGYFSEKNRDFNERRFEYKSNSDYYSGDPDSFFVHRAGISDSIAAGSNTIYLFDTYISDESRNEYNYNGYERVQAVYGMLELPIFRDLKLITGLRYETTYMDVESADPTKPHGLLDNQDWLPAANLVYQLQENMNLRTSYGRTIARPNMRELAPFRSFDFMGDIIFTGNTELERSIIHNMDIRWEWFERPGEIYAVSAFYKKFEKPMERAIDPAATHLVYYQNVDNGTAYGFEFELRKKLDFITDYLENFSLNVNLSIVEAEVDIPEDEYRDLIAKNDPGAETKRPLYGQSPYLLNAELSYEDYEAGFYAGVFYNVFGERLTTVALGATPNIFEQPRNMVNFTVSKTLGYGLSLKAGVKNLLDEKVRMTYEFKGNEYTYREYSLGRTFSAGLSLGI